MKRFLSPFLADGQRIRHLEKELLEDLKSFKHKQVIHPSLQEGMYKLCGVVNLFLVGMIHLLSHMPCSGYCGLC